MLRFLGAMIALMAVLATARAESVVLSDSMPSPVLKRPFPMTVYLPDGYERGGLRYPVLYLLHGAGGDENAWLQEGSIKRTADRMIARGEIQPAVIVMPGCRGCWWVDGAVDQAETAFWSDLVPGIERKYRVLTGRSGRLVAGLSAGGYGAVRFAMRYPDRFAAAAALSPAIYADAPPEMSSARVQPPFLKPDGTFDVAAWRAKNYTSFIDTYCRQKQHVPFYLVSGDHDRYGIAFETMTLFKRLLQHQPEGAELRIVDGDHVWPIWAQSIEGAMRYMFAFAERPSPPLVASASGGAKPVAPAAAGVASAHPSTSQVAAKPAPLPSFTYLYP